jgi:DNA-binding CsgD family transcriptional regulator
VTVARAEGVESEMELAFASLHQLCAPFLDRLDRLPCPQRDALRIVFGLSPGLAPDRFLVGFDVLGLVSEAAEQHPLLCVVDDAQWLDRTSAFTLAFVARRLLAEPVGMVFAAREPGEELRHLPQLDVRGLAAGDARALLSSTVDRALDPSVRDRIIAETRGNPLALLELPRGLTPTQLAGGFGVPGSGDLSNRIEASYARRVEDLPGDARSEALVAAVEASRRSPELHIASWALGELIEAATRTGDTELAASALTRLGEHTEGSDADWGLGIHARSSALVRDGDAAERLYREGIERLGRTRLRPELARAHLLYGEWLRREGRRIDARTQLRAAHDLFVTIGMEAFAERARGELLATGERVRRRAAETRDDLTAQERQIARLARDGLSNPEIGARLFLSPRTVEWHLRKVFTKLGIRSRRELAHALPSSDSELLPA